MEHYINDELIEATWCFCRRQLAHPEDADDAAQEILCEALRAIRAGRQIDAFHGWYWAMARRQIALFLRRKQTGAVSLEVVGGSLMAEGSVEEALLDAEEISRLNYAVSRLSALHREAVVLYYLREMKISDIAAALSVPEGTIKRRLHDAKTEIRKDVTTMTTVGKSAYAPADLRLWGGYGIPNYWNDISDLLTKQIFVACANEARTIREIADEIGVAPVYFEQKLAWLLEKKFIKESGKGRYLTDFCIYPMQAYQDCMAELHDLYADLGREVSEAILTGEHLIRAIGFRGNDIPLPRLMWILLVYAANAVSKTMHRQNDRKWQDKVSENNGKTWRLGGEVLYPDEVFHSRSRQPRLRPWSNIHYNFRTSDYRYVDYANLYQAPPFGDRDHIINNANADLFMRICDTPSLPLTATEAEMAAELVGDGYLEKRGDELYPTMPIFTHDQERDLLRLMITLTEAIAVRYTEQAAAIVEQHLLPATRKDLTEEFVHWIMTGAFFPVGNLFGYAWDKPELLEQPADPARSSLGICIITRK